MTQIYNLFLEEIFTISDLLFIFSFNSYQTRWRWHKLRTSHRTFTFFGLLCSDCQVQTQETVESFHGPFLLPLREMCVCVYWVGLLQTRIRAEAQL